MFPEIPRSKLVGRLEERKSQVQMHQLPFIQSAEQEQNSHIDRVQWESTF